MSISCFNPRSREGNDSLSLTDDPNQNCFNPRSREGNDNKVSGLLVAINRFNPRSREGNDRIRAVRSFDLADVSIHAPVKGTTYVRPRRNNLSVSFNPRSREGNDFVLAVSFLAYPVFQSTLP